MEYDVIGDIHGQGSLLGQLLARLGYERRAGGWRPPAGRKAVFLGDLIDRGDEQLEVLDVVRRMVDAGDALCVLGNHELNAIGWVTEDEERPGEFLRPHTQKKRRQHSAFLAQVGEGSARHAQWIDWFRTMPAALDLGGLRAVHAWWSPGHVQRLSASGSRALDGAWLQAAFRRGGEVWEIYEALTKGYELSLPDGATFLDKDGGPRREVRTQWWRSDARTYREIAVVEDVQRDKIPALPLPEHYAPTPVDGAPVFVGHYWLEGPVVRCDPKVACLDFSVANGGPLVAYRWCGEDEIRNDNFVWSQR